MPIPLLLATWNFGKVHEMRALLADLAAEQPRTTGIPLQKPPTGGDEANPASKTASLSRKSSTQNSIYELLTLKDAGVTLRVAEDGATYAENAARKALQYCKASGLLTMADDSGLEVDALDGAPGLHSARYSAKPGANDADRRQVLLQNLADKPRPWTARFRCTVVIAVPAGHPLPSRFTPAAVVDGISLYQTEGTCEGEIIEQERGRNGFGYDPVFLMAGLVHTMAELSTEEKNQLSHRARAVKAAVPLLEKLAAHKKGRKSSQSAANQ